MTTQALPQPTVLLFGLKDPGRLAAIRSHLNAAGIKAVEVPDGDWNQSLGALLELPGFARAPAALPAGAGREEMLVMFAFRDRMLGDLLRFFRERGLPSVSLKAMVTTTNVQWSAAKLQEELKQERAWIEAQKPTR